MIQQSSGCTSYKSDLLDIHITPCSDVTRTSGLDPEGEEKGGVMSVK